MRNLLGHFPIFRALHFLLFFFSWDTTKLTDYVAMIIETNKSVADPPVSIDWYCSYVCITSKCLIAFLRSSYMGVGNIANLLVYFAWV